MGFGQKVMDQPTAKNDCYGIKFQRNGHSSCNIVFTLKHHSNQMHGYLHYYRKVGLQDISHMGYLQKHIFSNCHDNFCMVMRLVIEISGCFK